MVEPYDPGFVSLNPALSLNHPSAQHLLGTTQTGQDVLSQVLTGIRLTTIVALSVGGIATVLSVVVGVSAAFLGGVWDEVLSLVTNIFLVIPALPLLIVLLGYLSTEGQLSTIIVLAFLGWPWGARVIRAQTLTIRNRDFIAASRESGEKTWRIISFEIIPNEISLIAANFVNTVLYAIGASVALAFAGLTNLSSWSLGTVLYWAQSNNALQSGAWWWWIPPGLAVALIGTSLVLLNSGIDEVGNPRLRASRGAAKIAGHRIWTTDPTPVLSQLTASRGRLGTFLHSFSRSSLLDQTPAGGELR
jgi:peptide/nickel transport system permease protein